MADTTSNSKGDEAKHVGRNSIPKGSQSASLLVSQIKRENMGLQQTVEEMERDYQVNLAKRVLSANANQAEVTFNVEAPEGADASTLERAEELSERISQLWESNRKSMIEFIAYGRVAYEKIWDYDEKLNLSFIRKLEQLPFRNTKMLVNGKDEENPGSFKGIELKVRGEEVIFYPSKAWWLAFEPTALEPHGRSMYLGAPHEVWKDRKAARDMRSKFIRRFALGGGVLRGPDKIVDEETGQVIDAQEAAAVAYGFMQGGGLFQIGNERVPLGEPGEGEFVWQFEDQGISQQSDSPMTSIIDSMDSEQLVAFSIPPKTVIEGDAVGSFALVSQQMLILYSVVEEILDQEIDSFQRFVIDKQAEKNFRLAKDERIIVATYARLTDRPDDIAVEMVKGWLMAPQLSPFVLSGAVDVAAVMESVGIPLSEGAEEKIVKMIEAQRKLGESLNQPATPAAAPVPTFPNNPIPKASQLANPPANRLNGHQNGNGPPLLPFPNRMG